MKKGAILFSIQGQPIEGTLINREAIEYAKKTGDYIGPITSYAEFALKMNKRFSDGSHLIPGHALALILQNRPAPSSQEKKGSSAKLLENGEKNVFASIDSASEGESAGDSQSGKTQSDVSPPSLVALGPL
jgi:hypothetical protein